VSKKVQRRQRRSKVRTRETLTAMRIFRNQTTGGGDRPFSVDSPPHYAFSASAAFPSVHLAASNRQMGSWAETMDREKVLVACMAVERIGGVNAIAFTLDLNPIVAEVVKSNPQTLIRSLLWRIGRTTPLLVVFGGYGADRTPRPHLHGVFAGKDADDVDRIGRALEAAGGPWAASRGGQYQLDLQRLGGSRSVDRWAAYLTRNVAEAEEVMHGRRLWSMTNAARRPAKQLYSNLRQVVNTAIAAGRAREFSGPYSPVVRMPPHQPEHVGKELVEVPHVENARVTQDARSSFDR
jgi:hypothetical protein